MFPEIILDDCFKRPPTVEDILCSPIATSAEVTEILIGSAPLLASDLTDAVALAARIKTEPAAAGDFVRIKVQGKMTPTDPPTQRVEGGTLVRTGPYQFLLEGDQNNDTQITYDALRYMQFGIQPNYIYFVSAGYIYGGSAACEDGIIATPIVNHFKDGQGNITRNNYKVSWEGPLSPDRVLYPLAS